jgi:hypothetical protein
VRATQVEPSCRALSAYLRACSKAAAWANDSTHRGEALALLIDGGFRPQGAEATLAVVPSSIAPVIDGISLLYGSRRRLGRLPSSAPGPEELVECAVLGAALGQSGR